MTTKRQTDRALKAAVTASVASPAEAPDFIPTIPVIDELAASRFKLEADIAELDDRIWLVTSDIEAVQEQWNRNVTAANKAHERALNVAEQTAREALKPLDARLEKLRAIKDAHTAALDALRPVPAADQAGAA